MMPQLRDNPNSIDTDPHGKSPRGVFLSLAKIGIWLVEEWYVSFFRVKKGTVLIYDRYYHDLLVDPKRYRFGAPLWIARLVGKLMPRPDLWILMLAPAEVLQARKQEVSLAESELECRTYLAFVRKQRKYVIVDASQPLDKVIADAEHAIRAAVLNGDNRG
jgi:thymidylate kinase